MNKSSDSAIVEREGDEFVSFCPELDVASQGDSLEEATANLKEAVELLLECSDPEEIDQRFHDKVFVTRFEAANSVRNRNLPEIEYEFSSH